MYTLIIHKKAAKFLKSRNLSTKNMIKKKLDLLREDPLSHSQLDIKKLRGVENVYRLRIGRIRIIYQVEKQKLMILIISAGSRGDIDKQ